MAYELYHEHMLFYSVSQKIPPKLPKRLGIFSPNFTGLLHVPIYANYKFLFN